MDIKKVGVRLCHLSGWWRRLHSSGLWTEGCSCSNYHRIISCARIPVVHWSVVLCTNSHCWVCWHRKLVTVLQLLIHFDVCYLSPTQVVFYCMKPFGGRRYSNLFLLFTYPIGLGIILFCLLAEFSSRLHCPIPVRAHTMVAMVSSTVSLPTVTHHAGYDHPSCAWMLYKPQPQQPSLIIMYSSVIHVHISLSLSHTHTERYIHTHRERETHALKHTHWNTHIDTHTHTHTHTHTQIHTHTERHTHMHWHTHIHTALLSLH